MACSRGKSPHFKGPSSRKGWPSIQRKRKRKKWRPSSFYKKYPCLSKKNPSTGMDMTSIGLKWMETLTSSSKNLWRGSTLRSSLIWMKLPSSMCLTRPSCCIWKRILTCKRPLRITGISRMSFTWRRKTRIFRKITSLTILSSRRTSTRKTQGLITPWWKCWSSMKRPRFTWFKSGSKMG